VAQDALLECTAFHMRLSVMAGLSGKCEEQMAAWLRMRDNWHAEDLDEVARQARFLLLSHIVVYTPCAGSDI
jgi:membrane protein required for beta-lactamase induction